MKPSGLAVIVLSGLGVVVARSADATTPIDFTQRNTPYAPGTTPAPAAAADNRQTPTVNETVQDKRVEKRTIDRRMAPIADRRAGFEVKETREKTVQDKDSHRPETIEHQTSTFNHRPAEITTGGDTTRPPTVAKYQDGLTAASATNMARFPAMGKATGAKINRFVFRKNPTEPAVTTGGNAVTPAAGGGTVLK